MEKSINKINETLQQFSLNLRKIFVKTKKVFAGV